MINQAGTADTEPVRLTTSEARARVRKLLRVEGDLAFRRRCETIIEWTDAGPNDLILDCGSGYGFVLRILTELTPANVVGLEYQAERVQETREILGPNPRLMLTQGNAMRLPFADDTFTHVVCSEVLEHLNDDEQAVAEMSRVLKPGGVLTVTVPSANFPLGWDPANWMLAKVSKRQLRGEKPWSGIWYGHQRLYTMSDLSALMSRHGFAIEEERGLTHYSPPFAHMVMYGIGKPLIQKGLVPATLKKQADRRMEDAPPPSGVTGLAMRILEWMDAPNDDADLDNRKQTFVANAIRARKPAQNVAAIATPGDTATTPIDPANRNA
ncbi:MAG: class I SAM-dependent methyltransferase [Thermomicrobiales bacterium]